MSDFLAQRELAKRLAKRSA